MAADYWRRPCILSRADESGPNFPVRDLNKILFAAALLKGQGNETDFLIFFLYNSVRQRSLTQLLKPLQF
jgi:hypothetical protein